ncbi:hypothetical protein ABL78_1733 [Leptomonas seymouri]|uniref:Uncharacterized protein n=1 Tax=Leptomonas seymouri TaxID=5684 RepID=A0A0N1PDU4_LEPSE|nr:hypothetical protein ABL78_1733 [Leptomonas seymouri]|eukprot:KPI89170.1 hypothetical protein ABL78_1733 [Leptomonas seymouri]
MRPRLSESPAVVVAARQMIASCPSKADLHSSRRGPALTALFSSTALCVARRSKSYHFYMNLDDPEATRLRVEEDLERLASENKKDSTAYLHSLLNFTLSHYQRRDFIAAHDLAEYTHTKAVAHNSASSLIYFTSTTCARCADALATVYEEHFQRMEAQAKTSAALTPGPSAVFSAKRAISKLRADAERYRAIAHRIYNRPDTAFMRGHGTRHAWQEESSNSTVDEEYTPHMYGERGQNRRKRPEHAEMKHYYKRQYTTPLRSTSEKRWTVPK